ncbi:MAG: FMN-binding protein [Johnsonella sp.]|nr:FMN-binding protein [Johnsonella sp.]
MKKAGLIIVCALLALQMGACAGEKKAEVSYKDGVYSGESSKDEFGGKITVEISVKDGKITEASMKDLDKNGVEKGEEYGKDIGQEGLYKKAQQAVEGAKQYPVLLVESGSIENMDAVSGATVSFKVFKEAVENALSGAVQ